MGQGEKGRLHLVGRGQNEIYQEASLESFGSAPKAELARVCPGSRLDFDSDEDEDVDDDGCDQGHSLSFCI